MSIVTRQAWQMTSFPWDLFLMGQIFNQLQMHCMNHLVRKDLDIQMIFRLVYYLMVTKYTCV